MKNTIKATLEDTVLMFEPLTDHEGKRVTGDKIIFKGSELDTVENTGSRYEFIYALQDFYPDQVKLLKPGESMIFEDERGSKSKALLTRLF